jgi:predicted dehydrogenase
MRKLKVGMIGCGGFARSMHAPNLMENKKYEIRACCDINEETAKSLCDITKAEYFTRDYEKVLNDREIDLVIISTRHNNHAELSVKAASSHKHILCEKPMAMNMNECREVADAVRKNNVKYTVGYNRGLSPFIRKSKAIMSDNPAKRLIYYRMQAPFPENHWTHDPNVGGGRFVGEGCHNFDVLCELVEAPPVSVFASGGTFLDPEIVKISDTASITITFADGSVGTVMINSKGCGAFPKEALEIYCDGKVIYINDYKKMELYGFEPDEKTIVELGKQDKGHKCEIDLLADAILNGSEAPNGLKQAARSACISYKVNESIASGKAIPVTEKEYDI